MFRKLRHKFAVFETFILSLLLAACATGGASPRVLAAGIPPTLTASAAAPTQAAALPFPRVLLFDDFSSEQASIAKGWEFGSDAVFDNLWQDHDQIITVKEPNRVGKASPGLVLSDFGAEIEAQPLSSSYVEYGIFFRADDHGNQYLFGATNQGNYFLQKQINGEWSAPGPVDMTPATPAHSPSLKPGQAGNRLGLVARGPSISLYLNGNLARTVTDSSLKTGLAGIFVATHDQAPVSVAFSRYMVLPADQAEDQLSQK